jgi:hypothetical protein
MFTVMYRGLVVLIPIAIAAAGCGSQCAEIAARRSALLQHARATSGPHAQVRVPLPRANAVLSAMVRNPPLSVKLPLPSLGPFPLPIRDLTAVARDVELLPSPADRLRFAIRVAIDDPERTITTLSIVADVEPELQRTATGLELVASIGPRSLIAVKPELSQDAGHALIDAIARWLPQAIRERLPRATLDAAAQRLATHLTGNVYTVLRSTLLRRVGELTTLRLRLPALPITTIALAPTTDAIMIDLMTELPVRRGLGERPPVSDDIVVRLSGSTVAALANWSIERGHLPRHYTRDLSPRPDGAYRPWFDYVAEERRPAKIHIFQERDGCSYFQVGMAARVEIEGDKLHVAIRDQLVEAVEASPQLEAALWVKQLLEGSVDSSRRAAAHTRLHAGPRELATRVVRAANPDHELILELVLEPVPLPPGVPTPPDPIES